MKSIKDYIIKEDRCSDILKQAEMLLELLMDDLNELQSCPGPEAAKEMKIIQGRFIETVEEIIDYYK